MNAKLQNLIEIAKSLSWVFILFFLCIQSWLFIHTIIIPQVKKIVFAEVWQNIHVYINAPVIVLVCLFLMIFYIIVLFTIDSSGNLKRFPFFQDRPFLIFCSAFLLFGLFFGFLPTVISDFFFNIDRYQGEEEYRYIYDSGWFYSSFFYGGSFGLFFTVSVSTRRKKYAYLTLPFLVLPFSIFNSAPILTFLGAKSFAPSKYWKFLQWLFLLLTFLPLMLYLPAEKKVRSHLPIYDKKEISFLPTMNMRNGYGVHRIKGKNEFYIVFREHFTREIKDYVDQGKLCRYSREEKLLWKPHECFDAKYEWNDVAINWEKQEAYIFVPSKRILRVFDLKDDLNSREVFFPDLSLDKDIQPISLLTYAHKEHLIYVCFFDGTMVSISTDSFQIEKAKNMSYSSEMLGLWFDENEQQIVLLTGAEICTIDPITFRILNKVMVPFKASSGIWDPERRLLWITCPVEFFTVGIDIDTMKKKIILPSPGGARILALDKKRDWLFIGSVSGMIRVIDLNTKQVVQEKMAVPFIHGMETFPETGEIVVTVGDGRPFVWQYDPPQKRFNLWATTYKAVDKAIQILGMKKQLTSSF